MYCFTHRSGLCEVHIYKQTHITLSFTTLEPIYHLSPHCLFSQSRRQPLPEISKNSAHADCPLPALQLPNWSLRGPCLEVWPPSQLAQGTCGYPKLDVLTARITWGAFINTDSGVSPRHGQSESPPGRGSFGMRVAKGFERHAMHKGRRYVRSWET